MPVVKKEERKVEKQEMNNLFKTSLPIRTVKVLPSRFMGYPEGVSITFVPYTFGEVLTLSQSKLNNLEAIDYILQGVNVSGLDKYDLYYQDYIYIALLRKLNTFKEDSFSLEYECSSCGEKNSATEKLSELDFSELDIPNLPVKVKDDEGNELLFSPLTINGYKQLYKGNKVPDTLKTYAAMVTNMEEIKTLEILKKASSDFLRSVIYVDELLSFRIASITRNCKFCMAKNELSMEDPDMYIWPFRGGKELIGDRISFGV